MFNNANGYSLSDIAAVTNAESNRCCNNGNGFGFDNGAWWIIILFLFCFAGWGGNGMFGGGFGGSPTYQGTTTREEIAYGFDINGLENGIRGIQNGLCDGFYNVNTSLLTGFNGLQNSMNQGFAGLNTVINNSTSNIQQDLNSINIANMQNTNAITAQLNALGAQQADCCCSTQRQLERGFADLGYNLATQECQTRQAINDSTRDIVDNQNAGVRSILDFLTQDKIATLQAENQSLKFAASQANQNSYLVNTLRPCPIPAYIQPNPFCNYDYLSLYKNGCCNTTVCC